MGLGKGESWDVGKPKSWKKTNDAMEETGCWVRLTSIGSCAVFLQDLKQNLKSLIGLHQL
ncbi:unnamed protein product [Camellia sinensis]